MPAHALVGVGLVLLVLCRLTRGATIRQTQLHFAGSGTASKVAWAAFAAEFGHTVSVNLDGIEHGQGHARRLLQANTSEVAQNISIDASGYQQAYDLIARTAMTGYELLPIAGSCGLDPQLDEVVADCANRQHACCFDASGSEARASWCCC